ncbi:uncharacterized protein LOC142606321 [Castanea sativa]|uniref:uncharacterized protein LOC142606321 n=1 Tax=Castanea sativa TaxID=21020 RepID=UPI003F650B2C
MARIKRKLDRQQGLVVSSVWCEGSLALLWKSSMKVDVQTYSPRHIDAIITKEQSNKQWRFTGFYGHPEMNKHEKSWRLLEELSKKSDLPWICMGDFNEIMHGREKEGGNIFPEWQMKNFRDTVNRCNLRDIGYTGLDFTWCKRREWVRERLDRALVSTNWSVTFPNRRTRRKKLFRFESMWLRDEGCKEIVSEAWDMALNMGGQHPFSQCLEECRQSLTAWNRNTFGHVGRKIERLQEKLQGLEGRKSSSNEFYAHDVEKALKQMHLLQAPSPDTPPKFHETHIVLIPKTKNPWKLTDYRPISLCNVAYKLASKAMANHLKLVLQDIICENQSAFVSESLITDNVLVAHELMNHINKKKKGLSALLHKAVQNKTLKGVATSARGPTISHLFFTDDSLIFGRATIREGEEIQRVLQLKQKVVNKLTGWKEKLLSNDGKEILIKTVAQAVPSYMMNCFKLPNTLCEELTGMDRKFWWDRKQAGVGVVVRDGARQVIAALCRKLYTSLGPLETKAKAMEIGVTFAMEVGVRDVTFEGDSLVICNAIHGLTEAAQSVQNVVTGILKRV